MHLGHAIATMSPALSAATSSEDVMGLINFEAPFSSAPSVVANKTLIATAIAKAVVMVHRWNDLLDVFMSSLS